MRDCKLFSEFIDSHMTLMGFKKMYTFEENIYYHSYYGSDIEFDLSDCADDIQSIMKHIFDVVEKIGMDAKVAEIKEVLNILEIN